MKHSKLDIENSLGIENITAENKEQNNINAVRTEGLTIPYQEEPKKIISPYHLFGPTVQPTTFETGNFAYAESVDSITADTNVETMSNSLGSESEKISIPTQEKHNKIFFDKDKTLQKPTDNSESGREIVIAFLIVVAAGAIGIGLGK